MSVHTVGNYLPTRAAFVDGKHVPGTFYADTERGFVRYYFQPSRANRRKTAARWAKKRGRVEVYKLIDPPERSPAWRWLQVQYWRAEIRIERALMRLMGANV